MTAWFFVMQFLDVLTTIIGLKIGLSEVNPFVTAFFPFFGPIFGVLASKIVTVSTFYWFFLRKRPRLMDLATKLFVIVVAWNIVIIVCGLSGVL